MTSNQRPPRRRVSFCIYGALFLGAATQTAITPLLPHIGRRFAISETAIGVLVAAPTMTVLALCVPIGLLADRLGARRLTIGASGLLCVAGLGQAVPSFGAVLVARLLVGVAFGTLLTAGVAWLSAAPGPGGSARLGASVTSTSAGIIVGPALGGVLGQSIGIGAPFALAGAAAAVLTTALAVWAKDEPQAPRSRGSTSMGDLAAAARDPRVRAGAGALAISGAVSGATQLLAPLALHDAHLSAGQIGLAFSAAAVIYVLTSALVVGAGGRAVSLRVNAVAAAAISLALAPAALSAAAAAVIATLLATSVPRSTVGTISYPLATEGAARSGLGGGIAIGVVNSAWAAGVVVAPLAVAALSPALGARGIYVALLAVTGAGAWALWLHARAWDDGAQRPHAPARSRERATGRWTRQPRVARRSDA